MTNPTEPIDEEEIAMLALRRDRELGWVIGEAAEDTSPIGDGSPLRRAARRPTRGRFDDPEADRD